MLRIERFARAVAEFVGDGLRRVTVEQYASRLAVCETCLKRCGFRCTECKCWLIVKARGRAFTCPLGKWPEIPVA